MAGEGALKISAMTVGRLIADSRIVMTNFSVRREGEAEYMTVSVCHIDRGNMEANKIEAMGHARALELFPPGLSREE